MDNLYLWLSMSRKIKVDHMDEKWVNIISNNSNQYKLHI